MDKMITIYHGSEQVVEMPTFWSRQEENELYFTRFNAWGTSVRNLDDDYTEKRLAASGK